MLRNRFFSLPALILVLLASSLPALPQQDFRDLPEIKPKAKANDVRTRKVTKSRTVQVRSNGVLFVLTDPDVADVLIKNSKGVLVKQARNRDGEFRAELPSGSYEVEVKAENHLSYVKKDVVVKPTVEEIVRAELPPTTGTIIVALGSIDPDLSVLLDGKKPAKIKQKDNTLVIDEIAPGNHTLKLTHPSIVDYENPIAVQAGADSILSPRVKLAVVNLTVRSEPGASVYVDDVYKGQVGGNREIPITGLTPGEHQIRAEKEKFQTAEQARSFAPGSHVLELPLKLVVFSGEFTEYFLDGASWDKPATWRVEGRRMLVPPAQGVRGEPGIGLVKGRIWNDFKVEFNLSFNNAKGAAWVVRAQDKQNYYLFQLSVPQKTFTSYVCKDGVMRSIGSVPVVEPLNAPGEQFHIIVDVKGPSISHFLKLVSNPDAGGEPMAVLTDTTFATGTVGFASKEGEAFTVYTVTVSLPQQASPR